MGNRILITSTDVMMYQFILPHVEYLHEKGYQVDVACSFAEGYQDEGYHPYIASHIPAGSSFFSIHLERNPASLSNLKGLRELEKVISKGNYDLIWTNEPVMGVMTRLAARNARKQGTKVFYLVHGYHFYKGAPKKNWIFYPIEKVMSNYCDAMCMINWEDYYFTQKHMPKKSVFHIDGIGFDSTKFSAMQVDRKKKREELRFSEDEIIVLSVGELQGRKNHEPVLRAIAQIPDRRIHYVICGWGQLKEHLLQVADELGMADRFHLLGHRYDIPEILKVVDIFAHPSQREGLGIAALEAMAAGLPMVTSNIQGLKDFVEDGVNGFTFEPNDVDGYKKAIKLLISDRELREKIGRENIIAAKKYDIQNSVVQVFEVLQNVLNDKRQ